MLDVLADLASDFSAIHGIDDMLALPGHVLFPLATRITAYESATRARLNQMLADAADDNDDEPEQAGRQPSASGPGTPQRAGMVESTRLGVMADPLLSQVVSFAGPPPGTARSGPNTRAGLSPADPANMHLLKVCPLCDVEDPEGLTPGTDTCGSWLCWPAHLTCMDEALAN